MIPNPNDGSRASRLQLDRYATGELSEAEAAEVERSLADHPEAQAHLDAIEAARASVRPFDMGSLRDRAVSLPAESDATGTPVPANDNRGFFAIVPVLLLAAIALFVAWPMLKGQPVDGGIDPTYVGIRGGGAVEVFHLEAAGLARYDHRALGEGDLVGFKVEPANHTGVVLLSIDGDGQLAVHWPEFGDEPEPIEGAGMVALPGTIVLDGAPGPEVFVAVFDATVPEARADAERAWQAGEADGLADWARSQPDVDFAVVNRK